MIDYVIKKKSIISENANIILFRRVNDRESFGFLLFFAQKLNLFVRIRDKF